MLSSSRLSEQVRGYALHAAAANEDIIAACLCKWEAASELLSQALVDRSRQRLFTPAAQSSSEEEGREHMASLLSEGAERLA